uniref:Uncharacterized protein n=1 Tax=Parascaris univalens TaxID=6257 RepID=A0A915A8G0_PARUN
MWKFQLFITTSRLSIRIGSIVTSTAAKLACLQFTLSPNTC